MSPREETVAVRIPLWVWGRLASKASVRGLDVADVVVAAADHVLGKVPVLVSSEPEPQQRSHRACSPEQVQMIKRLILEGELTNLGIAVYVGCHLNTVKNWKRKMREAGELHG